MNAVQLWVIGVALLQHSGVRGQSPGADFPVYAAAFRRGDFQAAAESLEPLNHRPMPNMELARRHLLQANALQRMPSQQPEAIQAFRAAIQLEPGLQSAYNNLGLTYKELRPAHPGFSTRCIDGQTALKAAVAISPKTAEPLNALGLLYVKCGALKAAVDTLQRAYNTTHNPAVAFNLALALHEAGKLAEAETVLVHCLEEGHCPKSFAQPRVALSSMRFMRGQRHESLVLLQSALRHQPNHALGLCFLFCRVF